MSGATSAPALLALATTDLLGGIALVVGGITALLLLSQPATRGTRRHDPKD